MRVRLLSDLHLELRKLSNMDFKKEADVVILAGDIGDPFSEEYKNLIDMLILSHEKVIIIAGNHEYYSSRSIIEIDDKIKELYIDDDDVHFLQMNSYIFNRVKFIGCTLWSQPDDPSLCKYMNDFEKINNMSHQKYIELHQSHKKWLANKVAIANKDYDKVCVITHHLPSYSLIDTEYKNDPLNSFFASNTFRDIEHKNINAWCYGHTHTANKSNMDGVDFYCNPRGYAHEKSGWNIDCIFEL